MFALFGDWALRKTVGNGFERNSNHTLRNFFLKKKEANTLSSDSKRCDVQARVVQGGESVTAHSVKGQKKWDQQAWEVLSDALVVASLLSSH